MGSDKATPRGPDGAAPMLYTRANKEGTAFEEERNIINAAYGLDGGGSVAADEEGNVYVAWHAPDPGAKGEDNRRIWIARSTDEGKTFVPEKPAYAESTGACGCCGMRIFADVKGRIYALYRSARDQVNRDMYLLTSRDRGSSFEGIDLDPWQVSECPGSTMAFALSRAGALAAWETKRQVYWARIDPATDKCSSPIAAPGATGNRKNPAVASNARGQTILVWTEGTGWEQGGRLAWQVFDKSGKPTSERGTAPGVPVWSLVAVFARPDDGFTIMY
jgi:hypothetical protein